MVEKEFGGELGMMDDKQPFVNTLWLSQNTRTYLGWVARADKHLKDINDLNESFRKVSDTFTCEQRERRHLTIFLSGSFAEHVQSSAE